MWERCKLPSRVRVEFRPTTYFVQFNYCIPLPRNSCENNSPLSGGQKKRPKWSHVSRYYRNAVIGLPVRQSVGLALIDDLKADSGIAIFSSWQNGSKTLRWQTNSRTGQLAETSDLKVVIRNRYNNVICSRLHNETLSIVDSVSVRAMFRLSVKI